MKFVTYQCADPRCGELHTAHVLESLPERPLSYSEIDSLPKKEGVKAARGHPTFRIYTGENEEYQESHTDMAVIVYDEIARLVRYIPKAGWAVEEQVTLAPKDSPEGIIDQLFDDRESGISTRN